MLNFFKRKTSEPRSASRSSLEPSMKRPQVRPLLPESIPVAQVVEGNEDSDWAMWEDSVSFIDSQMPTVNPEPVRVRQTAASSEGKVSAGIADPFARVGRKSS